MFNLSPVLWLIMMDPACFLSFINLDKRCNQETESLDKTQVVISLLFKLQFGKEFVLLVSDGKKRCYWCCYRKVDKNRNGEMSDPESILTILWLIMTIYHFLSLFITN